MCVVCEAVSRFDLLFVTCRSCDSYMAEEVTRPRGLLDVQYPLHRGAFINEDVQQKLIYHLCNNELRQSMEVPFASLCRSLHALL